MTDNFEGKEAEKNVEWSHSRFIGRMIEAVNGNVIDMREMPGRIDLAGPLGKNCDMLRVQTLDDPEKRERVKIVKLGTDGKTILISESATIGDVGGVTPDEYRRHPEHRMPQYIGKGKPIISLHTHNVDVPTSPSDLIVLFLKPEEGGLNGLIVITPERKFLLMKTGNTPAISQKEAISDARERSVKFQVALWRAGLDYQRKNRSATLEEGLQHNTKMIEQIQKAELLRVCQNCEIEIFTAMGESNLFYKGYNS